MTQQTMTMEQAAHAAKLASLRVATLPTATKNAVLHDLALAIEDREPEIMGANAEDMGAAMAADLPTPKLRRLELKPETLAQVREGLVQIAGMDDPVGYVTRDDEVPSGLRVRRMRTPIGVICMIYEARPAVTIDAFALCFKAGNACLLKGGREAKHSNELLASIARSVLESHGVPPEAITAITTSDREEMKQLLKLDQSLDLVIPRGGEALIRFVHEHARVPTVQHFHGVCHVYADAAANVAKAVDIIATGKSSAPATCNATECALIHESIAGELLPQLAERAGALGIELRGCKRTAEVLPDVTHATCDDFGREFLDLILAVRVVDSIDQAIEHVHRHGSNHTDVIVTEDNPAAERFCREVQSSCTLVNASTRFNDGFQLGLGAEIGISTSKVHAYGPMGLEELTVQRFVVEGDGQTR